jgi:topoisomerase-4 subunit A
MAEIDEGEDVAAVFPYAAGAKMLVASSDGAASSRRRTTWSAARARASCCSTSTRRRKSRPSCAATGDHVAVIGENRKLLVFPLDQLPEMARGKGVRLQRYKDGGLSDARVFALADGLTWKDTSGRTWTVAAPELKEWIGNRAEAGRLPPKGFPKNNKFG